MKILTWEPDELGREPEFELIHIDDFDAWNLGDNLAKIIHPALVKLKETKHGSPFVENEDVPECLWRNEILIKEDYDTDPQWHARWDYVLDKMIWAFAQILREDRESQFQSGEHDIYFEPCNDGSGCSELKHGPNDTFKIDYEAQNKYEAEISEGLRLFAKYYNSLWN
jgi:hypothetical protein